MDFADSETINSYMQFVGGDIDDNLMDIVCKNANEYVESCLKAKGIKKPDSVPESLRSAANYYAIQDLLVIVQLNSDKYTDSSFFKKAERLIDNYIKKHASTIGIVND